MIKNNEKRTSLKKRVIIVLITVAMLSSTFALYASMIIRGTKKDTEKMERFEQMYAEYMDLVDKQTEELSDKYFDKFVSYKSRVKSFNNADAKDLTYKDLVVGKGAKVDSEEFSDYSAYYIGWLSDETIFDSSFDNTDKPTALKEPLAGSPEMIEGWVEGIVGMHIGGVREITIPAALGYGDEANGVIPGGSALKFVVMLIDPVDEVDYEHLDELEKLFNELYGA